MCTEATNEESPTVRVSVRNIAGALLELDLEPRQTVAELKRRVEEYWHVPPACQKLIFGFSEIAADSERLSDRCSPSAEALSATMLVSLDQMVLDLESQANRFKKMQALECLARLGRRANEASMTAISASLEDRDPLVRQTALETLRVVAERGDKLPTAALYARLRDQYTLIRKIAVEVLSMVAERGNQRAVAAVSARLEDQSAAVRLAAVQAMGEVAERGDPRAVAAVTLLLGHNNPDVRRCALEALSAVADESGERALAALEWGPPASPQLQELDVPLRHAPERELATTAEGPGHSSAGSTIATGVDV